MRKPLSQKTRFEVFKRDGFTCAYCGSHPPDVVLEVDHIVPVAEGGADDIDNLTTSCFSCNRGKGAGLLTSVPMSLSEKAKLTAEREAQLKGYNAILMGARQRLEDETWEVFIYWRDQREVPHAKFNSVKKFIEKLGLPEVLDSVDIAMSKGRYLEAEWKYFCGVCWGKIKDSGQ